MEAINNTFICPDCNRHTKQVPCMYSVHFNLIFNLIQWKVQSSDPICNFIKLLNSTLKLREIYQVVIENNGKFSSGPSSK